MPLGTGTGGGQRRKNDNAQIMNLLKQRTADVKEHTSAVREESEAYKKLGSGIQEALRAMEKLKIIGNAFNPTAKAIKAAEAAFNDFNIESQTGTESIEDFLRKDKALVAELKNTVGATQKVTTEQDKLEKAQKRSKKTTQEQIALNEKTKKSLEGIVDTIDKLKNSITKNGGIKVQIQNGDFNKIMSEMSKAVDNFNRRKGNDRKNFFDRLVGSSEENKETAERAVKDAKDLTSRLEKALGDGLTDSLEKRLQSSISEGIRKGVELGVSKIASIDPTAKILGEIWDEGNFSQPSKVRSALSLMGQKDLTAIEMEEVKQRYLTKRENVKNRANAKAAADSAYSSRRADLEYVEANPNSNLARYYAAQARNMEAIANKNAKAFDDMINKEQQAEANRQRNAREALKIEQELSEVYGEEGTKVNELGKKLVLLSADLRQYKTQGDELNKINYAQVARKTEQIRKATKEWATELYKTENGYYKIEKAAKFVVERMKEISAMFQTTSATLSSAAGIWSTLRSKATSFFSFFTNGFRRAFSYARSLAQGLFNDGLEQREKIQQAQIGFKAFFGADRVDQVTSAVRTEAAKTPIVNAGDLADYVMQLAPVSGGNASLALNSSLGILKSLVYSGSDISEGEYVIKNIRDVIAKGTATAIDIRQFNRALPGLENAIKQMPDLAEFVDENGKLSITKANVGKVLDVFAKLNTDENSPLKDIEESQLRTLSGMKQLFEEKKTTAMESILEKSGVFDLLYKVLGLATNDGMWTKLVDFVSNMLSPLVNKLSNILTNTDWAAVGKKLQGYWSIIKEGIVEAKSIVAETGMNILNGATANDVFERIAKIISRFIKGLGEGVSEAMKFAQWLADKLSGGDLEGLAEMIGKYLVSPLGKIIQTLLGLGANSFGAASRALSTMAKVIDAAKKFTLWIKGNEAEAMASMYLRNSGAINTNSYVAGLTSIYNKSPVLAGQMLATTDFSSSKFASPGVTSFAGESGTTIRVFKQEQGKLATYAGKAGDALKLFGARLLKGASAAGIVSLLGEAANTAVGGLNLFGDKTKDIQNVLSVASDGITGAVFGGIATGSVAGGLVGALVGAAASLLKFKAATDAARIAEEKKHMAELLASGRKEYADSVVKAIQEAGINLDTESEEGRYAYNELLEYLNEFDDLGMVSPQKAEEKILQALRDKTVAQGLYDFTNSDEYNNLGGRVLDLDKDTTYRDSIANIIRENKLLGTDYDYNGTAAEAIVKAWLNGDQLTDEKADAIKAKYDELYGSVSGKTTDLAATIDNTSETIQNLQKSVDANTDALDQYRYDMRYENRDESWWSGLTGLIKDSMGYDSLVERGLYTTGDKTYGIGDIIDFINQKISAADEAGDTDALKKWINLNADVINSYASGEKTASQWFRTMMQMYGDDGFESFFNTHGISSTKDANGNVVRHSVDNYLDAVRDTDFTAAQARWFEMYMLQNGKALGFAISSDLDPKIKAGLENGLLSEEDKAKLRDRYKEIGDAAIDEFIKEHKEAAKNQVAGPSAPSDIRGKTRKTHWWDFLGLFPYYENHGGSIKPIYRATGGELGVDTVPAMLQPGEFVMRKAAVSKIGLSTMMAMNRGDMAVAARSLGTRFNGNYNNSRNWSNTVNNNQKTQTNYIKVTNRNASSRLNSYYGLANRIALA